MLTFRNSNIIFLVLMATLVLIDIRYDIPFLFYVVLVIIYSLVLFYGSAYVGSNFYLEVVCAGNTNEKEIAISFDDGPLEDYTSSILATLKQHDVKATFFCIGKRAEANKELLKRVFDEGHIIGNHSYSHSKYKCNKSNN